MSFNEATLTMYGAPSREEFEYQGQLQAGDNSGIFRTVVGLAKGETRFTMQNLEKDFLGNEMWVRDTVFIPVEHRNDWKRIMRTTENITEEVLAKQALTESEGRLRQAYEAISEANEDLEDRVARRTAELANAQRLANVGSWLWTYESDELASCLEEYARIHGVDMEEIFDLMKHQMERVIHPDDRAFVESEFKRFDAENSDFEIEYRIIRLDGEVRHLRELGEIVTDHTGRAIAHSGTVQDITQLKQEEEMLR